MAPNIEILNLNSVDVTDDVLLEIGKTCLKLEHVDLSNCQSLTCNGISQFLKVKKNLVSLNFEYNSYLDDDALVNLSL